MAAKRAEIAALLVREGVVSAAEAASLVVTFVGHETRLSFNSPTSVDLYTVAVQMVAGRRCFEICHWTKAGDWDVIDAGPSRA